jgi:hypothetical protein
MYKLEIGVSLEVQETGCSFLDGYTLYGNRARRDVSATDLSAFRFMIQN